jgi:nucleotide-binding universal stress UspA family protein
MFKHILVPVDLGPGGGRPLATARAMARPNRARVTLLHVIQRIEHVPPAELRAFYRRLEAAAQRKMRALAEPLARDGVAVRAVVLIGAPAEDIVRYAAANRVDLIILGSHRVEPGRRGRGFGTTSYKVGLMCACPVMLVK